MFDSILIANRGEIACRVIAAQRLGIRTIAVYSDAAPKGVACQACRRGIPHRAAAARESYLNIDAIIDAALGRTHTRSILGTASYPNARFAAACQVAGIVFIGPPASAIRAMGSKIEAKRFMARSGVPVVPGYQEDEQDSKRSKPPASKLGFPILIKASAGGGGKGMRVVESKDNFAPALEGARREAQAAFGDDRVLLEKFLLRPRHIEIQVFADSHGNCIHLGERDCSIQRRHQKVIEEAPARESTQRDAPGWALRRSKLRRRSAIEGAGTVEFVVEDGEFYFMEMNTRLQVEHPVTEMVTGLDLVEWQIRVAAGEKLPLDQSQVPRSRATQSSTALRRGSRARIPALNRATGALTLAGAERCRARRYRRTGRRCGGGVL